MKLIFIGSGNTEFCDFSNFQSNILLESGEGQRLLIGCGTDCRFSLDDRGLAYQDIDEVLISQVGFEQSGGLVWLGIKRKFDSTCKRPKLYLPKYLYNQLWDHHLSAAMLCIQSHIANLETFFDVQLIEHNTLFSWDHVNLSLLKKPNEDSILGVTVDLRGSHILISSENSLTIEHCFDAYQKADMIFQPCQTKSDLTLPRTHFQDLTKLPDSIKSKMWLYNYDPGELPDALQYGFSGFVTKGQEFTFS